MSWFEHNTSRINYEDCGNGDPVLVLPGFAGSIEELTPLREALRAAGYRVIAADLPGSGRSGPQPRAYTATYYADDARTFAALLAHLSLGPAHLVGFSDGGEVALLLAAQPASPARSVVTWGSAGTVNDPDGRLRHAMYHVIDDPIPPLREFRDYLIATYGEANARAMTQSVVGAFNDIVAAGGDISLSQAGNISRPALLIAGEHDPFAPPPLVSQLAARIPNAAVRDVPGAGHDLHHTHTAWLVQSIIGWLGKQESK
jgi:valacyclovir hydrolase